MKKLNDKAHFRKMFLDNYPSPDHGCLPVDSSVIKKYQDILPQELLMYWKQSGWCSYGEGLLWLVNPDEYESTMRGYLEHSPYGQRQNIFVVARSAFGEFLIWEKNKGNIMNIFPLSNLIMIQAVVDRQNLSSEEEEFEMNRFIGVDLKKIYMDTDDSRDQPLFKRSLKKLGRLQPNEMYGYKLSPNLGGRESITNLVKVDLLNYYDIQRQLVTPEVAISDTENNTLTDL